MPRKKQGWITFQSSEDERRALEEYCQKTQRTKTEVLRELLRELGDRQDAESILLVELENAADLDPESEEPDIRIEALEQVSGDRPIEVSSAEKPALNSPLELDHQPMASGLPSIRVSARNIIPGIIRQLVMGIVNAEVTIEVAPGVCLVSSITRTSAEKLNLQVGKRIYAVIKSNNIMIAED